MQAEISAWWTSQSAVAAATAASPKVSPQAVHGLLDLMISEPRRGRAADRTETGYAGARLEREKALARGWQSSVSGQVDGRPRQRAEPCARQASDVDWRYERPSTQAAGRPPANARLHRRR
jgi:hypothetical protein